MGEQLKRAYQFDFVHDGQTVFRQLLQAMANPGKETSLRRQAEKFGGQHGALMAIGCTLLDNEELLYVEKDPVLQQELHSLTLAKSAALSEADYVFISSEMNYGLLEQILKKVKKGTYADPQQSATLIISCQEIYGTETIALEGPGIDGQLSAGLNPYIKRIIEIRQHMEIEYPLGCDLIFASPQGEILCIPRLCRIKA